MPRGVPLRALTSLLSLTTTTQKLVHALDLHEQRSERPLMGLRVHGHDLSAAAKKATVTGL